MSTKRQYSLPNCNLILEGLEDANTESVDILDGRSPMSILINAECYFLKSNQKLSGGSVFLKNLSRAVSNYAQEFLSGFPQSHHKDTAEYPHVSLAKVDDQHLHRLVVEPEPETGETKTEIDLTTVELFDLVDAIDQFYVDRATLPDMTLELQSVSRRYRKPEQPLTERLTPVAIGFTSLAIAAGAFLVIPPPATRPPESNPVNESTEIERTETDTTPADEEPNSPPDN
ncbi:DUF4335 domain-containing protein [Pleurocapsales cyanobacterium LEGE 10410]|nr:DUF4335 domain-containing protein [Pleurocapsales cyanobacterium LEGE 10410]